MQAEAREIMAKQLDYLRQRRIEEDEERKLIEDDNRLRTEENQRLEKDAELRAELTQKLQKEAFMIRCSRAISRPYVFSYYRERTGRPSTSTGKK